MKRREFETKKTKSVAELKKEVLELKRKFVEISAKIAAGREKNLKAARHIRLEIAKLMSLISVKESQKPKEDK